jgi:4,5-dihydroxyphthalate decarboxylase
MVLDTTIPLTLAVGHYDRHVPFFDGTVSMDGVELTVLEIGQAMTGRHGTDRHQRMLLKGEFDLAEVSFSSYLMSKDRNAPFAMRKNRRDR